jgi:hypothetical protein
MPRSTPWCATISRRAGSAEPRCQRRAGLRPPPAQAFFQAFPNPACFRPRISKHFFGGFVGFQWVTRVPNPKCPSPNFFASAGALRTRRPAERVRVKIEIPSAFREFSRLCKAENFPLIADIARWGSGMPEIGEVSHRLVVGALPRRHMRASARCCSGLARRDLNAVVVGHARLHDPGCGTGRSEDPSMNSLSQKDKPEKSTPPVSARIALNTYLELREDRREGSK